MGKGKKGKNISLKDQGNQAFERGDVEKAIQLYSKGIEQEPQNALLYQNRAAAYIQQTQYAEALQDCIKALDLDQSLVKSQYRKAFSLYELGDYEQALQQLEKMQQELPEVISLKQQIQNDISLDKKLPESHPQMIIFQKLIDWLQQGGSQFDKLKLRWYSEDYRGVHAKTKLKRNQQILFVPKSHLITLEMAKEAPVGKKMTLAGLNLISPKHGYLSSYLLQEKHNENSFFKPYIDILPQSGNNFPIFYTEEELEWLAGSPFLKQIKEKKSDIKEDYDAIVQVAPEFAQYSIEEFSWARMTVASRIFGISINGLKTDAFVPLADMLNHQHPRTTSWNYDDNQNGFVIEAIEDIPREAEVMDSYGKKCNSRFLLNYGFYLMNNDGNEFPLTVEFDLNDQHLQTKQSLLNDTSNYRTFRVMADFSEKNNNEYLGFVRWVKLDDMQVIPSLMQQIGEENERFIKPAKIGPISIQNERNVLLLTKELVEEALSQYPNTLKEDIEILDSQKLTQNQRNCVLFRQGEKEILLYWFGLCDISLQLLDCSVKDIKKMKIPEQYSYYITNVIINLIRKEKQ